MLITLSKTLGAIFVFSMIVYGKHRQARERHIDHKADVQTLFGGKK